MGIKAKVIRGVYIKGVGHKEGAIVELDGQTFGELLTANYVVAVQDAPASEPKGDEGKAAKAGK